MFKIIDITPTFSQGSNTYEITGEVHIDKGDMFKAIIIQTLTPQQATGIKPGSLLSCLVEGEEKKTIPIIISW